MDLGKNVVSVAGITKNAKFASYEIEGKTEVEAVMKDGKIVAGKRHNVATVTDSFIYDGDILKGDEIEFIVSFEDNSKKSYIGQVLQVRDKTLKIIINGTQDINLIIKKIGGFKNGSTNK